MLPEGKYDDVADIYWQLHPARKIKGGLAPALHGGAFINRRAWKFQDWLQRIHDARMNALRKGPIDAGLEPSMDPFRAFFTGRNAA
ncbi:hypothetical protein [Streptomyces sp. NPDC007991]|uniref:hypothetical protein n=1 Tax=Streptomyces sp. NPDC007991 TaxID=3364803 RepID=UPI0036EE88BD